MTWRITRLLYRDVTADSAMETQPLARCPTFARLRIQTTGTQVANASHLVQEKRRGHGNTAEEPRGSIQPVDDAAWHVAGCLDGSNSALLQQLRARRGRQSHRRLEHVESADRNLPAR